MVSSFVKSLRVSDDLKSQIGWNAPRQCPVLGASIVAKVVGDEGNADELCLLLFFCWITNQTPPQPAHSKMASLSERLGEAELAHLVHQEDLDLRVLQQRLHNLFGFPYSLVSFQSSLDAEG
jgi:hypothetical protein